MAMECFLLRVMPMLYSGPALMPQEQVSEAVIGASVILTARFPIAAEWHAPGLTAVQVLEDEVFVRHLRIEFSNVEKQ